MTKLPEPNETIDALMARLRYWQQYGPFRPSRYKEAADRIEKLEGVIQELMEFVDDYSDVVDGDYGAPEPNRAMSLMVMARDVLGRST